MTNSTTANYPRGSEWRPWDLHFHTPSSYEYRNKSITAEGIINALKAAGVAAVAITDHHNIDVACIERLKKLSSDELTIFPGIELRTELGGRESVHIIGIFPETADASYIWTKLQGGLSLTPADIKAKGDDRVYVPFKMAADLIHQLGGLVSVHAGKKSNSIENISNALAFKQAVKEDLAKECVDILEIGRPQDAAEYEQTVFRAIKRRFPLVVCSDNHDVTHYERKSITWIRSDPTFEGLRQILNEPEGRVYVGDLPPIVRRVANNRTKYIKHVTISKVAGSTISEVWFDNTVPLNPGLVAIIGNKGSGKSALSDVIGLLGETRHADSFSFLNEKKFRQPKLNKARNFQATIAWENGTTSQKTLDSPINDTAVETIKYVPQNYLETICNELPGGGSRFDEELKSVIFSHVGTAERLGTGSIDQLIGYRTGEIAARLDLLRAELREINAEVTSFEERLLPAFRKTLHAQLAEKRRELDSHDGAKPGVISKPDLDPEKQSEMAEVAAAIEKEQATRVSLEKQRTALVEQETKLTRRLAVATKLIAKLANFKKQHEVFVSDAATEFTELGLSLEAAVQVSIDTGEIEAIKGQVQDRLKEIHSELDLNVSSSLAARIVESEGNLASMTAAMDAPNQEYQNYLAAVDTWEKKLATLLGDEQTVGSYKCLESQLQALDEMPAVLQAACDRRTEKAKEIFSGIESLADLYKTLYRPVQLFIEQHPLAKKGLQLDFTVSIVDGGFEHGFFEFVSQAKKGSFLGVEEGRQSLKTLLGKTDWNSRESGLSFLNQVLEHLSRDYRQTNRPAVNVRDQLKKEGTTSALYDFLFSFGYLKPRYRLLWNERELDELSPGERGTVLLLFYLLVDNDNTPLVIDQPEENLDNQTVFNILVPATKEARDRRQIIIVTHNPNLAVVCDADQIIYAQLDKKAGNCVSYISGAIENPVINRKILDVLEGTRPAFDNRDAKYQALDEE